MGTQIQLKISTEWNEIDSRNILTETMNIFYKVVARLSRFEESSDLSVLNQNSGTWIETTEELINLIQTALYFGKLSKGVFNIGIGRILEEYGYRSTINIVDLEQTNIRQLKKLITGSQNIEIDESNNKIFIPRGISIDLGSFAKGYAIKLARDFLFENKLQNFVINAGGDVYIAGQKDKNIPWKVTLFDPDNPEKTKDVEINNTAIASSGKYGRKYKNFHHLIHPSNLEPYNGHTVFVKGRDPMIADIVSTIAFFKPTNLSMILAETNTELLTI